MKAGRLEMSMEMGFSRRMGIPWERDKMKNLVAMAGNSNDPHSQGNSFPQTTVMSQK